MAIYFMPAIRPVIYLSYSNAIGPVISIWIIYNTGEIHSKASTPIWILLYGGVGIVIGLCIWGRRVIETIGENLTPVTPTRYLFRIIDYYIDGIVNFRFHPFPNLHRLNFAKWPVTLKPIHLIRGLFSELWCLLRLCNQAVSYCNSTLTNHYGSLLAQPFRMEHLRILVFQCIYTRNDAIFIRLLMCFTVILLFALYTVHSKTHGFCSSSNRFISYACI